MSNLVSSTNSEIILIKYSDGVKTIVTSGYASASYLISEIEKEIGSETDSSQNITWNIDWALQRNFGACQTLIAKDDIITRAYIINCPFPYSLGEGECEKDIQEFYPDYKYPYENVEGEE